MQNILTYAQNLTRVVSHGIILDADDRPNLPFAFDALYYEPPTGLAFKVLAGEQVPLTDAEIAACEAFCESFLDTADYQVFAHDDAGVFVGAMLRSEAVKKGLAFSFPFGPDHPASKWNGEKWQRIAASILDDGTLILDPEAVCDRCALAFTTEEWERFPAVPAAENGEVWKWDFAAEAWQDVADPLVFAFDEADVYVGQFARSYVLSRGWDFSREAPKAWPYKMTATGWQRVEAVISESGSVERLPGSIRDDAILLFTREEWAAWPARPKSERGEVWAWDFVAEAWRDASSGFGAAFEIDGERAGVFAGNATRRQAEKEGLGWTRDFPDSAAAKWDGTAWRPVIVVVMDDGTPRFRPDSVCARCMLALTADEWAAFPQPQREIPEQLGGWSWSFATEAWEDRRDSAELRRTAREIVFGRMNFMARDRMVDIWPDIFELNVAVSELSRSVTPWTDAYVAQSGEDREALTSRILTAQSAMHALMGRMAAQRDGIFARIDAARDNSAVDAVFADFITKAEAASCLPA